jgi:diketogulonate reductase-like aldo/keto reductase
MPRIGFGVYQVAQSECVKACLGALDAGYRHIDSAQLYRNEAEVGEALRKTSVKRDDIFITTKIGIPRGSVEATYQNVAESVRLMAGDDGYVDLFLVHVPGWREDAKVGRMQIWAALEKLVQQGKAKSIGVSNFLIEHLEEMKEYASTWPPAVNQIEVCTITIKIVFSIISNPK